MHSCGHPVWWSCGCQTCQVLSWWGPFRIRMWYGGCFWVEHRLIMLVMCDFCVSTAPLCGCWESSGLCVAGVDTLLGPQGPSMACRWWVVVGCWVPLVLVVLRVCVVLLGLRGCFLRTSQWTRASLCQVFKGTWWMPWHQKPMKDVRICDKPRVVDN